MRVMLTPPAAALAVLFAAGEPLEKNELARILEVSNADLDSILTALRQSLSVGGLALVETGDDVEIRTSPETSGLVKKLWEAERSRDLGKASLETLAVIAYQTEDAGVTRGDIDWVRGVNSSASMRTLLLRGLIVGKEDPADRRRMRYELTPEALAHLGVSRAKDLPRYAELAESCAQVVSVENGRDEA